MPVNKTQTSKRGRPKRATTPVMVRMHAEQVTSLDGWIAENGPPFVTRPEAIRRLIQLGLEAAKSADGTG